VYVIVDVVTRYWIGYLMTTEQTATQVQLLFAQALEDQGLLDGLTPQRLDLAVNDPRRPILLAWSDRGPEMTCGSTRQFMALMAIWQYHARPHTPPTRRTSTASSATSKASGRTWSGSTTAPSSTASSPACAASTTPSACTPASATSPLMTSTTNAAPPSAAPACKDSDAHDSSVSSTTVSTAQRPTSELG
jgi:hypothetical protein